VTVPYYAVARGVEQALIEVYGLGNGRNRNPDRRESPGKNPPKVGRTGQDPTLDNWINSIYPGPPIEAKASNTTKAAARAFYCVFTVGGWWLLRGEATGVYVGNNLVSWDSTSRDVTVRCGGTRGRTQRSQRVPNDES
jgi:hypothetical protein